MKISETPNERNQRLAEYCQSPDHVWVADSFHQGFGCKICNYSYWDWSRSRETRIKELEFEVKELRDNLRIEQIFGRNQLDIIANQQFVVRAAREFIAAPRCQNRWQSFGHEKCLFEVPCDTHCWQVLKHELFLLDNPITRKYMDANRNVICPNCHAQNGHTQIDGKACPGYPT